MGAVLFCFGLTVSGFESCYDRVDQHLQASSTLIPLQVGTGLISCVGGRLMKEVTWLSNPNPETRNRKPETGNPKPSAPRRPLSPNEQHAARSEKRNLVRNRSDLLIRIVRVYDV